MRFLISRLSSLGDVACTLPTAVALRRRFPESEIVWVASPAFADVVSACGSVSSVIEAKPGFHPSTWPTIDGRFDAAFDMQGLFKSAIVVGRTQARRTLGYHWQREGAALFSAAVSPDPTSLHVVDQYVDVVRAYGADMDTAEFDLCPKAEATKGADRLLSEAGVRGAYVVLNAGAGWVTKRWPPSAFSEVIKGLAGIEVTPVLIGGGDAAATDAADEVMHYCRALSADLPVSLVGQTSVAELIALIARAQAHVGGDTGSTHLAAALGVPAVGLYSITRPERCCPYGQIDRTHYNAAGLDRIHPKAVLTTLLEALRA
ncbi:MAG: glycosyltransferase family 9 protein [Fimbriimonadaceae bacterium]